MLEGRVLCRKRQPDRNGAFEEPERVRLVVPVHVARRTGVAIDVMLRLFVVTGDLCGGFIYHRVPSVRPDVLVEKNPVSRPM